MARDARPPVRRARPAAGRARCKDDIREAQHYSLIRSQTTPRPSRGQIVVLLIEARRISRQRPAPVSGRERHHGPEVPGCQPLKSTSSEVGAWRSDATRRSPRRSRARRRLLPLQRMLHGELSLYLSLYKVRRSTVAGVSQTEGQTHASRESVGGVGR
jgi:hypothetical protein